MNIRPDVPLVITVPTKVIDELDGHKRNRQQVAKGQLSIRNRAGKALRFLELQFRASGHRPKLSDGSIASTTPSSALYLGLIPQEISHSPLPDADLEIIDRALTTSPYAKSVHVVTTDYGMVFRARQSGLDVTRVDDFEEALEKRTDGE
ncbi:PIN domain-containing protein [Arthrobacter sp. 2RAF6]|uniref:PIN domain-containing protein n=1 Tax=Arthrobacter sp. 2RAF6 TaxID=3233002 RepID=UPI003F933191